MNKFSLLATIAITLAGCAGQQKQQEEQLSTKVEQAIKLSIDYLDANTLPSGRFVYKRYADRDDLDTVRYNSLRHAGVLYSMYLAERDLKDTTLRQKRLLAANYFIRNYIFPIKDSLWAVVSKEEEGEHSIGMAKLGASGLSLIALSNLYSAHLDNIALLRGLGNFILSMQQPDGSFHSKFDSVANELDFNFKSLYYPGEAALGLLYLYDVDPEIRWVVSAKKALIYLCLLRKDEGSNVPFDHWAMLATRKIFDTAQDHLNTEEKEMMRHHAAQIATSLLDKQIMKPADPYYGSFQDNSRPCSVGTIMEGMTAIWYVTDDPKLKKRVFASLKAGNEFLVQSQITDGPATGGLPTRADWAQNPQQNSSVVRMDNVQHVLSAWIGFLGCLKDQYGHHTP